MREGHEESEGRTLFFDATTAARAQSEHEIVSNKGLSGHKPRLRLRAVPHPGAENVLLMRHSVRKLLDSRT